jgi:homoserine dehydrogenase
MPALIELARYQKVQFRFSGTVAAGTQLLNYAKECFFGNRIQSIRGILNGTTNYILTRMFELGATMDETLKDARRLGYAEADPSYDVNGIDTACKLVILCNWILGRRVSIRDVNIEGIARVDVKDVERAKQEGNAVKLVGFADESETSVRPRLVSMNDPLCVKGTLNAVVLKTELAGEITITGPGAGGMETASAVLSDVIDIKRTLTG